MYTYFDTTVQFCLFVLHCKYTLIDFVLVVRERGVVQTSENLYIFFEIAHASFMFIETHKTLYNVAQITHLPEPAISIFWKRPSEYSATTRVTEYMVAGL